MLRLFEINWKLTMAISAGAIWFFILFPFLVNAESSYPVYFFYTTFLYLALAQAWNLVAGYTGQVSLGQHAFFGLGAFITAFTWKMGISDYLDPKVMLISGIGAALVAVLVGLPLLSRLRGDFFALGTLGLAEIFRIIALNGGSYTEGMAGISISSSVYLSMKHYYFIAFSIALLTLAVVWLLTHSRIGLAMVAIREDETAATAGGIGVLKYKVLAFAFGAFITALCGSLNACYVFHVSANGVFSLNWLTIPILMTVIGGTGTFVGPIIGVFLIASIFELTSMVIPEIHPVISGGLIVLATLFLPDGLWSCLTGQKLQVIRKLTFFNLLAIDFQKERNREAE